MYRATGLPGWMRYGAGYGHGRWGHWAGPSWGGPAPYGPHSWAAPSREDELAFLKEEAESAREYLEEVERRISELDKQEQE
jgi:hypothetical protein